MQALAHGPQHVWRRTFIALILVNTAVFCNESLTFLGTATVFFKDVKIVLFSHQRKEKIGGE
jgi:hypothetical protein